MHSLAETLLKRMGLRAPCVQNVYTSPLPPLLVLISWIYYLPLTWRKLVVDVCRIQVQPSQNHHLQNALFGLDPPVVFTPEDIGYSLTIDEFDGLLGRVIYSPLLLSFLSYFARAETSHHLEDFQKQKQTSLDKELFAALESKSHHQVLDYSSLFSVGTRGRLHPQLTGQIDSGVLAIWKQGLHRILTSNRFSDRPLLPSYNARKTVSYATQRNLLLAQGYPPESVMDAPKTITSLDLLKHYLWTGSQIPGPLEMRMAWFYNDLKPRVYYCLGGSDYFNGLYIQEISNLFVDIFPSTNPATRFNISRVGNLEEGQLLITYDYSSFTTSLSELRYFLFWLSEACMGKTITLLDVREGLVDRDLGEILQEYNDVVNHYQAFSIERFATWLDTNPSILRQGRNGSLGVKGNIVLSTTLHGVALADLTSTPDSDLCVGDDALSKIYSFLLDSFISCVNNLGEINPDKFTTIPYLPQQSPHYHQYKFLKRPLFVTVDGEPILGTLDFFPSIADALYPQGDGIHTSKPGYTLTGAARTFAMQWGRFLRLVQLSEQNTSVCDESELEFVLRGVQLVYKRFGLPIGGATPGNFVVRDFETETDSMGEYFLPPCDTVLVFGRDWMEDLLFRFHGQLVTLPVLTVEQEVPQSLFEGQVFTCQTGIAVFGLMESLGMLSSRANTRWVEFDEEVLAMMLAMMDGQKDDDLKVEMTYTVLSVPHWYEPYATLVFQTDYIVEDPNEAWERLSVATGTSI
jgi:hypothetical protein